jgi:hypothetical protein
MIYLNFLISLGIVISRPGLQKPGYTTIDSQNSLHSRLINNATKLKICLLKCGFKFQVFVHVSSTYCNCDRPVVHEIIYPPNADWKDVISMAEHFDERTLNILTPKYVQFYG